MRKGCISVLLSNALALLGVAGMGLVSGALASDYPNRRINIVVPTNPGGLTDVLVRVFSEKLQEVGKQPVVVENKAVGLGVPGTLSVSQAPPDGYTILIGNPAIMIVRPLLNPQSPYKATDFLPISLFGKSGSVLLVSKSVPANSVAELIALAKAKPGMIPFASQGHGTSGHMAAEQFMAFTKVDLQHVPYRGAPQAMSALLGGHVSVLFDSARSDIAEQIKLGYVRALAVTSPKRLSFLPDVPTMIEAGFPEVEGQFWVGAFAPLGTPPEIIEYLNKISRDAFGSAEVQARFAPQGMIFGSERPGEAAAFMKSELTNWAEIIRVTGMATRNQSPR